MPPPDPSTPAPCDAGACEAFERIVIAAFGMSDGYEELNGVVRSATAIDMFAEVGDGTGPLTVSVSKLRKLLDEKVQTENCVRALYVYLRGDAEVRQWVTQHRPDLLPLVPHADFVAVRQAYEDKRQIRSVGAVIARVRETMRLPPAMLALSATMVTQLDELTSYKAMHDILHRLQFEVLGELDRIFASDISGDERIMQLLFPARAFADATRQAAGLHQGSTALAVFDTPQQSMMEQFRQTLALLDDGSGEAARAHARGRFKLRSMLRHYMPALNDRLVDAATKIPFATFADMLRSLAMPATGAAPPADIAAALARAADDLVAIDNRLVWERDVHRLWQRIDDRLWQVEDALGGAGRQDELAFLWEDIKELAAAIRAKDIDPESNVALLDRFASPVDAAAPASVTAPTLALKLAFAGYARMARSLFFRSDAVLLADCRLLIKLKDPLNLLKGP